MKIAIIGAGVIGLSTGVRLLEYFPRADVVIYADKLTPDTTSDVAAGLWFPYATGENEKQIKGWCVSTYKFMTDLIRTDPRHHKYGIFEQDLYCLSDDNDVKITFVYKILPNSRLMNEDELRRFGDHKNGIAATTFMCQGSKLMAYLTERFYSNGGRIIQSRVECFDKFQAKENYEIIVNCSGLGARELCKDSQIYPLRGQIIKVEAPWVKFAINSGSAYILPQSDGTVVLGGTKQKDNYDLLPNEKDTADIMDKCSKLLPGLRECKILEIKVGLRPYRSIVRVESEHRLNNETGKAYNIIHNYGHGGSGLTLFWGCAGNVVELIKNLVVLPRI